MNINKIIGLLNYLGSMLIVCILVLKFQYFTTNLILVSIYTSYLSKTIGEQLLAIEEKSK